MKTPSLDPRVAYALLAAVCTGIALLAGWSSYAHRVNQIFYDLCFRQRGPQSPSQQIVIVGIDDATLARFGGLPLNRSRLGRTVELLRASKPKVIGMDILLTDVTSAESDGDLERALAGEALASVEAGGSVPSPATSLPRIVLATGLETGGGGRWLAPLPAFASSAAAIGHVHADPDGDGVSRQVLLAKQSGQQRYWALALECFRLWNGSLSQPVMESDDALEVALGRGNGRGASRIPATRRQQRSLLINYAGGNGTFPQVSLVSLGEDPSLSARLRDKIVLVGVTAQGTGDRLFTPFSSGIGMPGVEIHANILHTLLTGNYLLPVGNLEAAVAMLAITLLTLSVSARWHGGAQWLALIVVGGAVLIVPYALFLAGQVWPAFSLLVSFATALVVGEAFQLLVVRRSFLESEAKRKRSQQQFEMAAHEMRTPLAAIQASSELLARYSLEESKREQMIQLVHEESKRLGQLVERFLSVERLSAGDMALRRKAVKLSTYLPAILERLRPVAERRNIQLICKQPAEQIEIEADPELLEFAVSNLLTNAVKYSPPGTSVKLAWEQDRRKAQIHVYDSGTGLTTEQASRIFDRFYRAESAERSDAPGFGLGLAIAREIARHHGGDIRATSAPGLGSRFTIWLPLKTDAGTRKLVVR